LGNDVGLGVVADWGRGAGQPAWVFMYNNIIAELSIDKSRIGPTSTIVSYIINLLIANIFILQNFPSTRHIPKPIIVASNGREWFSVIGGGYQFRIEEGLSD
jgi:hypothetical protein